MQKHQALVSCTRRYKLDPNLEQENMVVYVMHDCLLNKTLYYQTNVWKGIQNIGESILFEPIQWTQQSTYMQIYNI